MMIQLLMALATGAAPTDTVKTDTLRMPSAIVAAARFPQDTIRRRPRAIEVSEWYHRRLVVHKALSYATIPVFAVQYYAGQKLFSTTTVAPSWAKPVHQIGASTVAGIFGVNTATGLWNLWDSRHVEDHRVLRTTHALMMLGADAAFAYTGIKLSDEAGNDLDARRQHRTVALGAMGVTIGSGVIMKIFNK